MYWLGEKLKTEKLATSNCLFSPALEMMQN